MALTSPFTAFMQGHRTGIALGNQQMDRLRQAAQAAAAQRKEMRDIQLFDQRLKEFARQEEEGFEADVNAAGEMLSKSDPSNLEQFRGHIQMQRDRYGDKWAQNAPASSQPEYWQEKPPVANPSAGGAVSAGGVPKSWNIDTGASQAARDNPLYAQGFGSADAKANYLDSKLKESKYPLEVSKVRQEMIDLNSQDTSGAFQMYLATGMGQENVEPTFSSIEGIMSDPAMRAQAYFDFKIAHERDTGMSGKAIDADLKQFLNMWDKVDQSKSGARTANNQELDRLLKYEKEVDDAAYIQVVGKIPEGGIDISIMDPNKRAWYNAYRHRAYAYLQAGWTSLEAKQQVEAEMSGEFDFPSLMKDQKAADIRREAMEAASSPEELQALADAQSDELTKWVVMPIAQFKPNFGATNEGRRVGSQVQKSLPGHSVSWDRKKAVYVVTGPDGKKMGDYTADEAVEYLQAKGIGTDPASVLKPATQR